MHTSCMSIIETGEPKICLVITRLFYDPAPLLRAQVERRPICSWPNNNSLLSSHGSLLEMFIFNLLLTIKDSNPQPPAKTMLRPWKALLSSATCPTAFGAHHLHAAQSNRSPRSSQGAGWDDRGAQYCWGKGGEAGPCFILLLEQFKPPQV